MKIGGQIPVIVRGAGLWGKGCNLKRGGGGTSYHQDVVGVCNSLVFRTEQAD